jgi:hypothetical protein
MHYYFDGGDEILQHWNRGLGSHYLPYEAIKKASIDDTVSFRSLAKRKIINDCKKSGRTFYYIDTGYVGNLVKKKLYHRVVKNDVQHSTVFDVPDDRWRKIRIRSPELEFVEWRKNHKGKILLVTPSEKPCKFYNIDRDRWVEDTIKTLKNYTDREIIVRDKGKRHERVGEGSVPKYLIKEKIYATVTYQSIAAIESVCVGVPAFTMQKTAADSVTSQDLSKIESPFYPSKHQVEKWQHWLAYCQYHIKELGSGEAVRIMKEHGLL